MSGFHCQECGHAFKTIKAAEKAFGDKGCPKCGGSDIDTGNPKAKKASRMSAEPTRTGGAEVA